MKKVRITVLTICLAVCCMAGIAACGSQATNSEGVGTSIDDTETSASEQVAKETQNTSAEASSSKEGANTSDYKVFASEKMGFSFLYDSAHTAYINDDGAAMLAINGDEARTGLFVSVRDASSMPTVDQFFEEEIFNLQQRYQNAMAMQPEKDTMEVDGHTLTGIVYAYSMPSGGTVDCTEFVEVRDGKYIFYDTRMPREQGGPELEALAVAMESMQFDASYYGASDAKSGGLPIDDHESAHAATEENISNNQEGDWGRADAEPIDDDWGRADAEPINTGADFEGNFSFDYDTSYLLISDETTAQVYTGGAMDGAYFSVSKVDLTQDIGNTVVARQHEIEQTLQNRMVTPPEVELLDVNNERHLAGLTVAYSAVDGSKTIESEEYYEEIDGQTYCWYAIYDRGDTVTRAAMEQAMQTFRVN